MPDDWQTVASNIDKMRVEMIDGTVLEYETTLWMLEDLDMSGLPPLPDLPDVGDPDELTPALISQIDLRETKLGVGIVRAVWGRHRVECPEDRWAKETLEGFGYRVRKAFLSRAKPIDPEEPLLDPTVSGGGASS